MTSEICKKSTACSLIRHFNVAFVRISILAFLLSAASSLALAADQKSNFNPCRLTEDETAALSGDTRTDVHAERDYMAAIGGMLKDEEFDALDCLADHARLNKERFPGGAWKIHELYGGLYEPVQYPVKHATEEDWANLLQSLQHWVDSRPKSVTARVALARAYIFYAYDARGTGLANTVSDSGWKLFRERIAKAKRILDDASVLPARCPEWYVDMLLVGQYQSWDVASERALFEEAAKFEPGYYYYPRVLAAYLLPKWHGEEGDTERFVQETADRIGGDQGDILYFQVASADYVICGGCEQDPVLSVARIERGFEAAEKQYGVSMMNLNRIAFLTSRYREGDVVFADKALSRIGDQWDEDTWQSKENFDWTRKAAANYAPVVARNRVMEAAAQADMQTPQGPSYKVSFEKTYRELIQQCVRTDGAGVPEWVGKFEALTSLGPRGTVEDGWLGTMGPVAACLYEKVRVAKQEKTALFPPPPHAPYAVRLDLDWAEFAPAAAK